MAWKALRDSVPKERHILNTAASSHLWPEGQPNADAVAACGVTLDVVADADSELPCCAACEATQPPRRQYHSGKKLPRCTCPTCGGVHIKDRNHVEP